MAGRSAAYGAAPRQAKTVKQLLTERCRQCGRGGLDVGKYFWRSGREKCFSLDIPFYRTNCPIRASGPRNRMKINNFSTR